MTPRKSQKEKLKDDVEMDDAESIYAEPVDEQDAASDEADSDNGDTAAAVEDQSDNEHSMVGEPAKKKTKVRKTPEEKAATAARAVAATEAVLSDRFVWKDGKPEPFESLRQDSNSQWERVEDENHCDFVDRLHKNWKDLEQEARGEIMEIKEAHPPAPISDDGEVEYVDVVWRRRSMHCETFLKVDLDDPKDGFRSSKILTNFNKKMADYDKSMSEDKATRAKLIPYIVAINATEKKLETDETIKKLIEWAYETMDSRKRDQWESWIADGERALRGEVVDGFPRSKGVYKSRYTTVSGSWKDWESGGKEWTKDRKMNNDRNLYASDPVNNILRRPSANGDVKAIYVAFDKNGKLIVFLDPQAIPWSYDEDVHKLMKDDSHEFYTKIKAPNTKSNKRHTSQREHLKENSGLKPDWCGSDHYGHWHAQQHTNDPILETGDSHSLNATQKQLLLQFLKYTGGPMTRILDFWFGVWEPQLRQRYRDIYANSPEFARLPPVNKDHPDTYCLRVSVCNRPTDEHRDQNDIKGGLTGLVHLGDFKGAAMCVNKLGIALDGYGDGAALLLRGTEMKHYISQWSGNYRYAFDHTTHQSVEDAIKEHEMTGRWGAKKDATVPKARKEPKGARKSKKPKDEDDEKPDGGDASGKPQGKRKQRPHDDDGKELDGNPAPKKRGKASAVKGRSQVRTSKEKSGQVQEAQSETQLPEKGGHNLRQRKKVLYLQ